jgi:hypothetical protein
LKYLGLDWLGGSKCNILFSTLSNKELLLSGNILFSTLSKKEFVLLSKSSQFPAVVKGMGNPFN